MDDMDDKAPKGCEELWDLTTWDPLAPKSMDQLQDLMELPDRVEKVIKLCDEGIGKCTPHETASDLWIDLLLKRIKAILEKGV